MLEAFALTKPPAQHAAQLKIISNVLMFRREAQSTLAPDRAGRVRSIGWLQQIILQGNAGTGPRGHETATQRR